MLISSLILLGGSYIANLQAGWPWQALISFEYINASIHRSGVRPNLSFVNVLIRIRRQSGVDLPKFSGTEIILFIVKAFYVFRL